LPRESYFFFFGERLVQGCRFQLALRRIVEAFTPNHLTAEFPPPPSIHPNLMFLASSQASFLKDAHSQHITTNAALTITPILYAHKWHAAAALHDPAR
jgi:hypothetical protein